MFTGFTLENLRKEMAWKTWAWMDLKLDGKALTAFISFSKETNSQLNDTVKNRKFP
jgi:hypothetical protein